MVRGDDTAIITPMNKPTPIESHIRTGRIVPGMTFNQKVWALTARVPKRYLRDGQVGATCDLLGCAP